MKLTTALAVSATLLLITLPDTTTAYEPGYRWNPGNFWIPWGWHPKPHSGPFHDAPSIPLAPPAAGPIGTQPNLISLPGHLIPACDATPDLATAQNKKISRRGLQPHNVTYKASFFLEDYCHADEHVDNATKALGYDPFTQTGDQHFLSCYAKCLNLPKAIKSVRLDMTGEWWIWEWPERPWARFWEGQNCVGYGKEVGIWAGYTTGCTQLGPTKYRSFMLWKGCRVLEMPSREGVPWKRSAKFAKEIGRSGEEVATGDFEAILEAVNGEIVEVQRV
jgi:hypothetical protein